ncbi:MAG: cytochrome c oxidase assembly protein [Rhodomicrobium sp.]
MWSRFVFDTNLALDLPWRFEPVQREVEVHLGREKLVFFTTENLTDKAIARHATFNVTPDEAGRLLQEDPVLLLR